jgi:hypothetical protein
MSPNSSTSLPTNSLAPLRVSLSSLARRMLVDVQHHEHLSRVISPSTCDASDYRRRDR